MVMGLSLSACCPILTAEAPATLVTPAPPSPAYTTEIGTAMIGGVASWYDYRPGEAAAGPALRSALGKGWRGQRLRVCHREACTVVVLTDWCQCFRVTPDERLIDLDVRSFAALAHPDKGLIQVQIELP